MKKLLTIVCVLVVFILSSCSPTVYYQTQCLAPLSENITSSSEDVLVYSNEDISIQYDFWGEGGIFNTIITNKTDSILYVELDKSYMLVNGIGYYYFSATNSIVSNNETTYQGMIFSVPPKASRILNGDDLNRDVYYDCDLSISDFKSNNTKEFTLEDTPLTITNYISYKKSLSSKDIAVENSFYVNKVVNLRDFKFKIYKRIINRCGKSVTGNFYVIPSKSPSKFYISFTEY